MTVSAGKTEMTFEPKMSVDMNSVAQTETPDVLKPTLGPLANLKYKPSRVKVYITLSSAPGTGTASFKLLAGATEVFTSALSLNGVTEISIDSAVDLSAVAGETKLAAAVDVTAGAGAGITAEVTAKLEIDNPVTQVGC